MSFLDKLFNNKNIIIKTSLVNNSNNLKLEFNESTDALTQVFNAYSFYGDERHVFNKNLISKYKSSIDANDILAVAICYENEGYSNRKDAILYFEKYFENPTKQNYFSEYSLYSMLSSLYEKEYCFDKAIECLNYMIKISNGSNSSDFIRIGNILLKKDVDLAITYYDNLIKNTNYKNYKDIFINKYQQMIEKKNKGYKYKARKQNKEQAC